MSSNAKSAHIGSKKGRAASDGPDETENTANAKRFKAGNSPTATATVTVAAASASATAAAASASGGSSSDPARVSHMDTKHTKHVYGDTKYAYVDDTPNPLLDEKFISRSGWKDAERQEDAIQELVPRTWHVVNYMRIRGKILDVYSVNKKNSRMCQIHVQDDDQVEPRVHVFTAEFVDGAENVLSRCQLLSYRGSCIIGIAVRDGISLARHVACGRQIERSTGQYGFVLYDAKEDRQKRLWVSDADFLGRIPDAFVQKELLAFQRSLSVLSTGHQTMALSAAATQLGIIAELSTKAAPKSFFAKH